MASKGFFVAGFSQIFQITIIVPASFMLLTAGSIPVIDKVDSEYWSQCDNKKNTAEGFLYQSFQSRNHELMEDHTCTFES